MGMRAYARLCTWVCVGVTGVSGFSNNYEFSEYLLETNVFMQWPLIQILFEFFFLFASFLLHFIMFLNLTFITYLNSKLSIMLPSKKMVSMMFNATRLRLKEFFIFGCTKI